MLLPEKLRKEKLKNLLLPNNCYFCLDATGNEYPICAPCLEELPPLSPGCQRCGLALANKKRLCGECITKVPPFHRLISLYDYDYPTDWLVSQLKFSEELPIANFFGKQLTKKIQQEYQGQPLPECIVPVPLHRRKLHRRGYNQAIEIARPITKALKIPINHRSCRRIVDTPSQGQTRGKERLSQLKEAFKIQVPIKSKHVAIIDDVVTTGHTIRSLSGLLAEHGVKKIDIWCACRTQIESSYDY